MVIYHDHGHPDCPATICRVRSDSTLYLMIFSMEYGAQRRTEIDYDPDRIRTKGWFWPPKV